MRGMTERSGVVMVLTVLTVLTGVLKMADAHQLRWGSCTSIKPFENFEPRRFNGSWYVLKKLKTSSRCMSTNFLLQDGGFVVTEIRTPILADMTSFSAVVSNEGYLDFDSSNPAKMSLNWEGNMIDDMMQTTFTIVDTDYDTYAVDVECQSWMLFKRVSATILSRSPTLPADLMEELEEKLAFDFDIDTRYMNTIDHSSCFSPDQVDYNIKIDENGLNVLGMVNNSVLMGLDTKEKAEEYFNEIIPDGKSGRPEY